MKLIEQKTLKQIGVDKLDIYNLFYEKVVKLIPVTRGKFAIVDPSFYEWLSTKNWHATEGKGGNLYAVTNITVQRGFVTGKSKQKAIKMHRLLLELTDPDIHGDHIRGNTLNNRMTSLRPGTNAQNCKNRKKQKGIYSSSHKGLTWHRDTWDVRIQVDGKMIHIGSHKDEKIAAAMYNEASIKHHGNWGHRNIIK